MRLKRQASIGECRSLKEIRCGARGWPRWYEGAQHGRHGGRLGLIACESLDGRRGSRAALREGARRTLPSRCARPARQECIDAPRWPALGGTSRGAMRRCPVGTKRKCSHSAISPQACRAVPQSKLRPGRIRSIDRTKRRHALAGSCGSTQRPRGLLGDPGDVGRTDDVGDAPGVLGREVDGEGVEDLRRQPWALHDVAISVSRFWACATGCRSADGEWHSRGRGFDSLRLHSAIPA